MKGVFLCGGISKRMFPITKDKVLIDFLGKPLLQHQIEMAQGQGLNHFVLIGNPQNMEKLEQISRRIADAEFEFFLQKQSLGMADALKSAESVLQGPVLVLSPNDVFSSLAYSIIEESGGDADSYMLGCQVKEYFPGGYLEVDSRGYLKHIVEKPLRGEEPSNLVNMVVHLHKRPEKLLEYIHRVESDSDDVYERALDNMVRDGYRIKVIPYTDFWGTIKYPWHILKVMDYFLDQAEPYIAPSARISDRAVVEGKVVLAENVRVLENAVIRGPVYVGPNSIIGNNVLLRDHSHIGSNCVIGYSTEVKHSYIGDNCWFHSNYVGDSIIDDECSFGSGAITANFRFDEANVCVGTGDGKVDTGYDKLGAIVGKGCRLGINANLMPGVRVGAHSFVGPHVCLTKDLDANKMALPVSQYEVLDNNRKPAQERRQELFRSL